MEVVDMNKSSYQLVVMRSWSSNIPVPEI